MHVHAFVISLSDRNGEGVEGAECKFMCIPTNRFFFILLFLFS